MKRKLMSTILVIAMVFGISATAMAAVNGGSINQYQSAYLTGENGADLAMDAVTLNQDAGTVAYFLEPSLISTRADAVYEEYVESNDTFLKGVRIIMQYGYPLNLPDGLDTSESAARDKARYATQAAISAWAIHCGVAAPAGWADFAASPAKMSAKSGNEAVLTFVKDLLSRAMAQQEMQHTIALDGSVIKMDKNSDGTYTAKVAVNLTNCNGGYGVDPSALPMSTQIAGYTGNRSEVLTFTVPESSENEYQITFIGLDTRTSDNFKTYTCTNQTDVSKLVSMTATAAPKATEVVRTTVTLSKTSGVTGSGTIIGSNNGNGTGTGNGTNDQPGVISGSGSKDGDGNQSTGAIYVAVANSLVFYERNATNLTPIQGIAVTIRDGSGNVVQSATTNDKGCIDIGALAAGKYTFAQDTVPNGYELNSKSYKFAVTIDASGARSYSGVTICTNDINRLNVLVKDTDSKEVKDATVEIYKENTTTAVQSLVTGSTGTVQFTRLDAGKYDIKVTKIDDGSASDIKTATVEITNKWINSDGAATITMTGAKVNTSGKGSASETQTGPAEAYFFFRMTFAVCAAAIGGWFMLRILRKSRQGV